MRRLMSLAALVALVVGVVRPITCAGWEARAADRMECCERAHHHECGDQSAADRCCAGQEASQFVAPSLPSPPSAPQPALPAPAFDHHAATAIVVSALHRVASRPLHPPPPLSPPPLRI